MQNTSFITLVVEPQGSTTPTTVIKAAIVPMRVLVSNVGPVMIWVSAEVTDLTPAPSSSTFRIFAGEQFVFVVSSTQSIYALAAGAGGLISVSLSEAIPTDIPRI